MPPQLHNDRGFTLIEVLLSLALLGIVAGFSAPLYTALYERSELNTAEHILAQTLRKAQLNARAVADDTSWGVRIQAGTITLFQGSSYTDRDTTFDIEFAIRKTISVSGNDEYVFSKLSGRPTAAGTTTLRTKSGQTRQIAVNAVGTVSF